MTEAEWLGGEDIGAMLASTALSARKLRLFAVARVRLEWGQLKRPEFRYAVEASERFADSPSLRRDLDVEEYRAHNLLMLYNARGDEGSAARAAALACMASALTLSSDDVILLSRDCEAAAPLLREVAGNPFRSVTPEPAWLTLDIRSIAQAAYADRSRKSGHLDTARLRILSDALEEVGCDANEILSHLRSPGPHVRGCWALDLVLGKS